MNLRIKATPLACSQAHVSNKNTRAPFVFVRNRKSPYPLGADCNVKTRRKSHVSDVLHSGANTRAMNCPVAANAANPERRRRGAGVFDRCAIRTVPSAARKAQSASENGLRTGSFR